MSNLGTTATQDILQTAQQQAGLDKIKKSAATLKSDKNAPDRVSNAAQDFEAVFISEMIKPMFDMIKTDGMFGGGHGEDVFRGLMVQEYGKMISAQGGVGIAAQVQAELLRTQEQAQAHTQQSQTTGES